MKKLVTTAAALAAVAALAAPAALAEISAAPASSTWNAKPGSASWTSHANPGAGGRATLPARCRMNPWLMGRIRDSAG